MSNLIPVADEITGFIAETFAAAGKTKAVIAVSGGIDSALSLALAARALTPQAITPILLPYGDQNMDDARTICEFVGIAREAIVTVDIAPIVARVRESRPSLSEGSLRLGNVMARARMICVFDLAKELDALVIGTENKSEHYLGYFTRFGDAASDLEPLSELYKTEVRALAQALNLPDIFLSKAPSAGLWPNQTDETELGFSYELADHVLKQLVDEQRAPSEIVVPGATAEQIAQVVKVVHAAAFKHQVPYTRSQLWK